MTLKKMENMLSMNEYYNNRNDYMEFEHDVLYLKNGERLVQVFSITGLEHSVLKVDHDVSEQELNIHVQEEKFRLYSGEKIRVKVIHKT